MTGSWERPRRTNGRGVSIPFPIRYLIATPVLPDALRLASLERISREEEANMRAHRLTAALSALTCTLLVAAVPAATAADAPYCGITWGSLQKSAPDLTPNPIVGARVGRHDCFDRLVIDINGRPAAGYYVSYVDVVRADGSGDPLPVTGGAKLRIHVLAPGHDQNYRSPGRTPHTSLAGSPRLSVGREQDPGDA
jgi:hypothetical protein